MLKLRSIKTSDSIRTSLPVDEEILGQPFGPDDLEDDLVGLQGLEVHPAGQGRVQALGQTFANRQLLRNHLVLCIVLQYLGNPIPTNMDY